MNNYLNISGLVSAFNALIWLAVIAHSGKFAIEKHNGKLRAVLKYPFGALMQLFINVLLFWVFHILNF